MAKTPEQMSELNRAAVETAMKLAQVSMENAEQLVQLQLLTVRQMLADNLKTAKALADAKDPAQLAATRSRVIEGSMSQLASYTNSVYTLAAKTQNEFGKIMESRYAAFNREVCDMVDAAAKSAPPAAEPAVAAMKQTLAAANAMIETMSKTAKQFADAADSSVKAATAAAKSGAKKRA
ncbi:MAG: phasin family protein [Burkholderiales bacterium]|nr:phasin family protein [Burkholderiales bacterium]